jgi:hypothetical protein
MFRIYASKMAIPARMRGFMFKSRRRTVHLLTNKPMHERVLSVMFYQSIPVTTFGIRPNKTLISNIWYGNIVYIPKQFSWWSSSRKRIAMLPPSLVM